MTRKGTIADQILGMLWEGDKWADEIVAGVSAQPASIRACLGKLVKFAKLGHTGDSKIWSV